ncbi:hypothetical protein [Carboxylicivirga sp. N1Y90]|nr:hypothetical protein [Marinilabiliaceae bacterium N1Y90]
MRKYLMESKRMTFIWNRIRRVEFPLIILTYQLIVLLISVVWLVSRY